jgi:protein-L-isoaspartate(D-aspartate) O-methyltransferase
MRNFRYLALSAIRATCKSLLVLPFLCAILLYSCRICSCSLVEGDSEQYKRLRYRMVDQQIAARGIEDEHVLQAMRDVLRHLFVPEGRRGSAYGDFPVPIGYGQTISQPYIVALMTELLEPEEDDVALEVGTGSGYHAAVLSRIVKEVYTVEIIPPLGRAAEKRLKEAACENIRVRIGDGYYGWEEYAPFDCIIVTAASDHIPPPLIKQLKRGGKMAIPVGSPFQVQNLMLVEKSGQGEIQTRNILPVRFVPFRRNWK